MKKIPKHNLVGLGLMAMGLVTIAAGIYLQQNTIVVFAGMGLIVIGGIITEWYVF